MRELVAFILTATRVLKRPISVPVSLSNAVECYPCREVPSNYNKLLLFHGGARVRLPYGTPILTITYEILPFRRES